MANNRLYLVDPNTNEQVLLAKGMGRGWEVWAPETMGERLQAFFEGARLVESIAESGSGGITDLIVQTEAEMGDIPPPAQAAQAGG